MTKELEGMEQKQQQRKKREGKSHRIESWNHPILLCALYMEVVESWEGFSAVFGIKLTFIFTRGSDLHMNPNRKSDES